MACIKQLQAQVGKPKRPVEETAGLSEEYLQAVRTLAYTRILDVLTNHSHDKASRDHALNEVRTDLQEKLKEAQAEMVTAKQKIARLPSLERKYRAALAEQALQSTQEGQAILDAITAGDVKSDILMLPSA